MQDRDIRFFEEFKRLEKLCGEIYGQKSGVSAYIGDMESRARQGQAAVPSWASDHKALKRARWVRNQLAHDSVENRLSTAEDLAFVQEFHRRILDGRDPLALLEKAKKRAATPARTKQAAPSRETTPARSPSPVRREKRKNPRLLPLLLALAVLALLAAVLLTEQGKVLIASLLELLGSTGHS